MTGYGYGEASAGGVKVQVELSSVNRKQLDVHVALPRAIAALESRVVEVVHETIARGQIAGTVTVGLSESARRKGVHVESALAAAYVKQIRRTAAALGLRDDLTASDLVRLPEVVAYESGQMDFERIWPILSRALKQALGHLVRMRMAEGTALENDLRTRFEQLLPRYLEGIRKLAPAVTEHYRRSLRERLRRAGVGLDPKDPQVLREVVLFAERSDISEEITRLQSHLKQARELLRSKEPVGRTLDFLAQEMLREVNTVASKANDAAIARHVIHFKTELERIREQAQNIE
jgi:uncharacterized protein (TIGR00255 family)